MYNVKKPFKYAHGGHTVVAYEPGEQDLPDDAAKVALAEGWAEKAKPDPDNKAVLRAPRNKGK
jgi:hypothetical protein